jgi:hypothetical protein
VARGGSNSHGAILLKVKAYLAVRHPAGFASSVAGQQLLSFAPSPDIALFINAFEVPDRSAILVDFTGETGSGFIETG